MFTARLNALTQRRAALLQQSEQQRHALAVNATALERPLQIADAAVRVGQFIRQRPVLFLATASIASLAMRKNYLQHRPGFKKAMAAFRLARSAGQFIRAWKDRRRAKV